MSSCVSEVLSRLSDQSDVFVWGRLDAPAETELVIGALRLGSGAVVSASGRRLAQVGEELRGRKLKVQRLTRGAAPANVEADVHLVALQQLEQFSRSCRWAVILEDVLVRALDSYAVRSALRELLSRVDAACIYVDHSRLAERFSLLLGMDPRVEAFEASVPVAATSSIAASSMASLAAADSQRGESVTQADTDLFERLRAWRRDEAHRREVPAYRVMTDRVLRQVCADRPPDVAALAAIPGVGERTLAESGPGLLAALRAASR